MIQPGELKVGARAYIVRGSLYEWHFVCVRVVSFDDETACVHGARLGVNYSHDDIDEDDDNFDFVANPGRICFAELGDLFLDETEAENEVRARIRQGKEEVERLTRVYEEAGTDGIEL